MNADIYLGTSGWSYKDWEGSVYPEGLPSAQYLKEYAWQYPVVEIDSTFYGIPRSSTVQRWKEETPDGFLFAPKFPQVITHEKELQQCAGDVETFLNTMSGLGDKLGPLLLQFPYGFKSDKMETLAAFLETLPEGFRYAVEIRHKSWLNEQFYQLLEGRKIALALIDHPWMPRMERLTADFTYIRWLGDRKQIPDDFSYTRIDMTPSLEIWAAFIRQIQERIVAVYGFFNNHYEGHSPSSLAKLRRMLSK